MNPKAKLRHQLKLKRQAQTQVEVKDASDTILNQLINIVDWQNIHSLNTYVAVEEWKEIDTRGLLDYVWQNWPHIQTSTMRVEADAMHSIMVGQSTKWVEHSWGMAEPVNGRVLHGGHQFDLIIVPVLGFDGQNNRLGLGKGYYDRFLAKQVAAQKIGLAYAWARVESLPHEPHDVMLDIIATG